MPIVCLLYATKKSMFVWELNVGRLGSRETMRERATQKSRECSGFMVINFTHRSIQLRAKPLVGLFKFKQKKHRCSHLLGKIMCQSILGELLRMMLTAACLLPLYLLVTAMFLVLVISYWPQSSFLLIRLLMLLFDLSFGLNIQARARSY